MPQARAVGVERCSGTNGYAMPASVPEATRTLTPDQLRAIRTVMRLFKEEDLGAGRERIAPRWCVHCEAHRPGAGFIRYEDGDLCNPCATEYEIVRARGIARTVWEFRTLGWDTSRKRRAEGHAVDIARTERRPTKGSQRRKETEP